SLQIAIDAAKQRREPIHHLLCVRPPGLGKTTLALLMAKELGVNVRTTSGPVLERPGDLVGLLTSLQANDILFIDEVHRLRPALEEFLYPAMEDYRVDVRLADGPHAQTIPMALERFTLIGATTRFGLLTPPMRARFGLVERLSYYPPDDLAQIIGRSAGILGVPADVAGIAEIARRSRGTPRVANRLLKRVRDYAQVRAGGKITALVAGEALLRLDVERGSRNAAHTATHLVRVSRSAFRVSPMRASDFDYQLPPSLIAQDPLPARAASRLLILDRASGAIRHGRFTDVVDLIAPGDVVVVNVSRVIPARLHGTRDGGRGSGGSGGKAELLLVRELPDGTWLAMGHPGGKLKPGRRVTFGPDSVAEVVEALGGGLRRVRFVGLLD